VLARLRAAIEAADGAALEAVFARSRTARSQWQEQRAADDASGGASK
jgi:prephenate dehydrogenase